MSSMNRAVWLLLVAIVGHGAASLCVPGVTCPPVGDPCVGSALQPTFGDCRSFLQCSNGVLERHTCGWLSYFDSVTNECRYFWRATCSEMQNQDECTGNWNLPDPGDCSHYYTCTNGHMQHHWCSILRGFNRETKKCDWSWNVPYCTDDATCLEDRTRAIPNNCSYYEECQNGKWTTNECPYGLKFDKESHLCKPEIEVSCLTSVRSKREANWMKMMEDDEPTPTPTDGTTPTPTKEPTSKSTEGPTPTEEPTSKSTEGPTPTPTPTEEPTSKSTEGPTPTPTPTEEPTSKSTEGPTPTPTDEPTSKPTPTPTTEKPECVPGQKVHVPNSCTDYYLCDTDAKWIMSSCSSWCKHFNGQKCVWAWQYPCTVTTTPPSTNPSTDPSKLTTGGSTEGPTDHSSKSTTIEPVDPTDTPSTSTAPSTVAPCKEGEVEGIAGDCRNYMQCKQGKFSKQSCSWYDDFDCNYKECRSKLWAKCC